MTEIKGHPFIKWAGGKRQLLPQIREMMPAEYNRYIEPFVGGGAVFFELQPEDAVISDINPALINAYLQIKENPDGFLEMTERLDCELAAGKREYYYEVRAEFNEKLAAEEFDTALAAMLVFLNKHCFNGLYRVNGKGLFNVPYNNSIRKSCDRESILAVSRALQGVKILTGDFQRTCDLARKGDFVFLDSPYAPLNPTSFEAYTKEGFDLRSHRRLAEVYAELTGRGCFCMLTNHNTELINELYGKYSRRVVPVKRLINSDAKKRTGEEIIITNY